MALPSSVEGFGIVVLEANACGVPVVASSGVPEGAVRHGRNGLRYPFGDQAALAAGLIEILTDEASYRRLSASSLASAGEYGFAEVCGRYEKVIRDAVAARMATV